jgi:branched-chain amino acid transport system ATP-binding protein
MDLSDWIVVLNHGEKIAEGISETIRRDENVLKAYLGEEFNVKS